MEKQMLVIRNYKWGSLIGKINMTGSMQWNRMALPWFSLIVAQYTFTAYIARPQNRQLMHQAEMWNEYLSFSVKWIFSWSYSAINCEKDSFPPVLPHTRGKNIQSSYTKLLQHLTNKNYFCFHSTVRNFHSFLHCLKSFCNPNHIKI